ncbi:hypothetical protein FACS1894124_8270 [Spirochaetia bacterium]|nr:hypothetical protein FACS1894124_8270 [Spirochaetia bacterium]
MILRKPGLPSGWYPQSAELAAQFLRRFSRNDGSRGTAVAVVAPHAGWAYSGELAARSVAALRSDAETVVVAGGHLPAGAPPLFAMEDGVLTPLGALEIDGEFRDALVKELGGVSDNYADNTVEVQLPIVKYFFPKARLVSLRLGAEIQSAAVGRIIARTAAVLGRSCVLLGSTDLTHYGKNYGFCPYGSGPGVPELVKTRHDDPFIQAALSGGSEETLRRAEQDSSACSVGAVLACQGFAQTVNAARAELLAYATSADALPLKAGESPESFVGYAAMAWSV